jgi:hypothetical protein
LEQNFLAILWVVALSVSARPAAGRGDPAAWIA